MEDGILRDGKWEIKRWKMGDREMEGGRDGRLEIERWKIGDREMGY